MCVCDGMRMLLLGRGGGAVSAGQVCECGCL
jgi:hypothetical protein